MKFWHFISSPKFYIPVLTILITFTLIKVLSKIVKRLVIETTAGLVDKRRNTIVSLANKIICYALIIVGFAIILSVWGINVTGFIAGLGIAGVIGGLALQDALKDIIMGCNIILDNFFVVGDMIKVNDFEGEVIEFDLKSTKIKSFKGNVLVICNREITNVINYSKIPFCLPINIDVAYHENTDKVNKVLNKVLDDLKQENLIKDNCSNEGINELSDSSVKYLLCIYCSPKKQGAIKRLVLDRVKREFDKNNIEIPFPQIEVHNGK